jgi:hypothetical protein
MSKSQRDKVAWNYVEFPHLILDLRVYFRFAPARLRAVANMCDLACGYAAVCLLRPLWFA